MRALILALFATVSAILSNYFALNHHKLWAVPLVFLKTPLLPGIFFGIVLGLAIWVWVSQSAWKILTVLLSTVIAWIAGSFTTQYALDAIAQMLKEIAAPDTSPTINFMCAVSGALTPRGRRPSTARRQEQGTGAGAGSGEQGGGICGVWVGVSLP